ncbi:MAG: NUDIX domain-containing protein [Prevotella sp.]|nr:NUDIX domain-containing protein [Prevotella sp.]
MEHPLEKFAYCPICGSKYFMIHNFKSKKCEDCGFVYYANPCAATAAFIVNDRQEILVVRRAKEPAKGTLDLPGGFVDMYETAEEGMRREIKEETGLDIDKIEYLFSSPNVYLYSGLGVHTLDMDYLAHVSADVSVKADDDAEACLWIPITDLHPEEFGLLSIRHAVEKFLALNR